MKYLILTLLLSTIIHADPETLEYHPVTTYHQAETIVIRGTDPFRPLLKIYLPTGRVESSDSLTATEAGRIFVDYLRKNAPCGTVEVK